MEEVGWGGLLHKLTHISPLRPWVLPAPSGSVGWICRSFHGPLIFKMGLCSGQREVSEKYWPVRERTGSGYQRLPADTNGYQRLPADTRSSSSQDVGRTSWKMSLDLNGDEVNS